MVSFFFFLINVFWGFALGLQDDVCYYIPSIFPLSSVSPYNILLLGWSPRALPILCEVDYGYLTHNGHGHSKLRAFYVMMMPGESRKDMSIPVSP